METRRAMPCNVLLAVPTVDARARTVAGQVPHHRDRGRMSAPRGRSVARSGVGRGKKARRRAAVAGALLPWALWAAAPVAAQPAAGQALVFGFVTAEEARPILGARDEFVRAMSPLERSARLRTTEPVDESRLLQHRAAAARDWEPVDQRRLAPILQRLADFVAGIRWQHPDRILLAKVDDTLEDGSPHTRANAIVLPGRFVAQPAGALAHLMAHEVFHILTRDNAELRERLYAAIGFRRCETVTIPQAVSSLRITNPDAVESRHTIAVRLDGQPVEALPYIRFASGGIDPREGLMKQLVVAWLIVDRSGGDCRARGGPGDTGIDPGRLQGLAEQIGRNTGYLFHPEEILAENFAILFRAAVTGSAQAVPSPEILDTMRTILFDVAPQADGSGRP
jgi:hypothetical protein